MRSTKSSDRRRISPEQYWSRVPIVIAFLPFVVLAKSHLSPAPEFLLLRNSLTVYYFNVKLNRLLRRVYERFFFMRNLSDTRISIKGNSSASVIHTNVVWSYFGYYLVKSNDIQEIQFGNWYQKSWFISFPLNENAIIARTYILCMENY